MLKVLWKLLLETVRIVVKHCQNCHHIQSKLLLIGLSKWLSLGNIKVAIRDFQNNHWVFSVLFPFATNLSSLPPTLPICLKPFLLATNPQSNPSYWSQTLLFWPFMFLFCQQTFQFATNFGFLKFFTLSLESFAAQLRMRSRYSEKMAGN